MRLLTSLALLLCLSPLAVEAIELPDGSTSFAKSPRLLDFSSTMNSVSVWGAKYYLTLNLPSDTGLPLQSVTLQQREGIETIGFNLKETFAFLGDRDNRQDVIAIQQVTRSEDNTISIVFERAIDPGRTVTIGLVPHRNPFYDGVYLFGITAFPTGDKPRGLNLGVGRLQFYRGGGVW